MALQLVEEKLALQLVVVRRGDALDDQDPEAMRGWVMVQAEVKAILMWQNSKYATGQQLLSRQSWRQQQLQTLLVSKTVVARRWKT